MLVTDLLSASAPTQALQATIVFFGALAAVVAVGFVVALSLSRRHRKWRRAVGERLLEPGVQELSEDELQLLTIGDLMANPTIRTMILENRNTLLPRLRPMDRMSSEPQPDDGSDVR